MAALLWAHPASGKSPHEAAWSSMNPLIITLQCSVIWTPRILSVNHTVASYPLRYTTSAAGYAFGKSRYMNLTSSLNSLMSMTGIELENVHKIFGELA